ncbi:hypothetical protein BU16DRAFT_557474 [Lophium mytilinum]|uniref:Uncharacterized protein n=1 Tax=Lophium mytilinum TaxID=390894 RepID=A0A6A6R3R1_9PEZI|nr:hypothetical protein BU16DRAFT_557474 [Lophium mytilinum]
MLRDIPNKVTDEQLLRLLWDEDCLTSCIFGWIPNRVPTTIMLRNIPNKMTDEQLLRLLWDTGCRGLIDFMSSLAEHESRSDYQIGRDILRYLTGPRATDPEGSEIFTYKEAAQVLTCKDAAQLLTYEEAEELPAEGEPQMHLF